ncbi:MAG: DUF4199 domain-containing protein [Bacteroidia bacterium]
MRRIVIIYGIIAGLIVSVLMLLTMPFEQENPNFDNSQTFGYLGMLVAFSMIFVAIIQHRKQSGGHITFGKAFLIGLFITLIAGLFYAITWEIYLSSSGLDFMKVYSEEVISKMEASGESAQAIESAKTEMLSMAEMYKNPFIRFGFTLMEIVPVGLLISLIAGFSLKRKKVVFS